MPISMPIFPPVTVIHSLRLRRHAPRRCMTARCGRPGGRSSCPVVDEEGVELLGLTRVRASPRPPATLPISSVLDWPMMMKTCTGLVMSAGLPSGSGRQISKPFVGQNQRFSRQHDEMGLAARREPPFRRTRQDANRIPPTPKVFCRIAQDCEAILGWQAARRHEPRRRFRRGRQDASGMAPPTPPGQRLPCRSPAPRDFNSFPGSAWERTAVEALPR
jgi:hypothetical protein